jgi:hypothetical protein
MCISIISSIKILFNVLDKNNFLNYSKPLLARGVTIRVLIDDMDRNILDQIHGINRVNENKFQFAYSNKLGSFDELVIIKDGNYVSQIKYVEENKLIAKFSNEEHSVLVRDSF